MERRCRPGECGLSQSFDPTTHPDVGAPIRDGLWRLQPQTTTNSPPWASLTANGWSALIKNHGDGLPQQRIVVFVVTCGRMQAGCRMPDAIRRGFETDAALDLAKLLRPLADVVPESFSGDSVQVFRLGMSCAFVDGVVYAKPVRSTFVVRPMRAVNENDVGADTGDCASKSARTWCSCATSGKSLNSFALTDDSALEIDESDDIMNDGRSIGSNGRRRRGPLLLWRVS